ncbi:histidine phosphatase family protein [Tardiphaga sp. vice154]|uniref:histidine phosphatase family protein n=1 Tax=Tardiphaga sp. vice154 TaxID=2592814 RepID=UPI0011642024|nr:histidine phosphatase family protein [Tardiphaga sp. vice154]QDM23568.1 histidine phosphatase family protein [Tardiphaga sp. vice154]
MPQPTIYYIRHGQTEWNALGRFQGSKDIPLNDLGREQAAHAGGILKELLAQHARDADSLGFVSSPLGRARSTMEFVRSQLELPPQHYALDDRLREIGYGHWEGSTLAEQEALHPEIFAARELDKWSSPPPEGESYASVQLRMRDWYEGLTGDTVAVAHGGTARALMVALDVQTIAAAAELPIEQGAVYVFSNGGLAKYT